MHNGVAAAVSQPHCCLYEDSIKALQDVYMPHHRRQRIRLGRKSKNFLVPCLEKFKVQSGTHISRGQMERHGLVPGGACSQVSSNNV